MLSALDDLATARRAAEEARGEAAACRAAASAAEVARTEAQARADAKSVEAAALRSKYDHYKHLYTELYARDLGAAKLAGKGGPKKGASAAFASPSLRVGTAERAPHGSGQDITPARGEAEGNAGNGGSEHMQALLAHPTAMPPPSVSPTRAAEPPTDAAGSQATAAACAGIDFAAALRPDGDAQPATAAALGCDALHAAAGEGMQLDAAPRGVPSPERVAAVLPPCAEDPITVDATQCCDRAARGLPCEHVAARAPPAAGFQPAAAPVAAAQPQSSALPAVMATGRWHMRTAAVARSNMEGGVGCFLSDLPLLSRTAAPGDAAGSGGAAKKKPRLRDGANTSNMVDDFLFSTPSGPPALTRVRVLQGVEDRGGEGGDCPAAPPVASPHKYSRTNWSLEPRRKGLAAAAAKEQQQPAGGGQRPETGAAGVADVRDVERRRTVRAAMQTFECAECSRFYDALDLPSEEAAKRGCRCGPGGGEAPVSREGVRQHVGRHRAHWQPALTPAGFWNLGFDPTQQPAGSGLSNGQSQERVGWGLPP